MAEAGYRTALLDWLACALAGTREPAAVAARAAADGLEGRVAAGGTAGHVLDFDDTYAPGLVHLSAPTAPVAVVLGAAAGASVGEALDAYAAGFEAMAALSAANHPRLRERGWHPTSVCGAVGAATTAARLLGLDEPREREALGLALLAASGLRAAFGSDGKALQVGGAAAAGVRAARLAQAGATAGGEVTRGFEATYGARWASPRDAQPAVRENWIKAYPCCLQTHSAIDAALAVRAGGNGATGAAIEVIVHPVTLTAAERGDVATGLEAKFSIPYLTAHTLMRGAPEVRSFEAVDEQVRAAARRIAVVTEASLGESEARLRIDGETVARVEAAVGSPANPMTAERHAEKIRSLAGESIGGVLGDPGRPVLEVAEAAGLG